jgi:hypothetical protein
LPRSGQPRGRGAISSRHSALHPAATP